jgi:hypothetical protein
MAAKVDFKKTVASYRAAAGVFGMVEVPDLHYLMIDGHGDPNTSVRYAQAIETLYPIAYSLKFTSKNDFGRDYVVPPLEALWWADEMSVFTTARDKARWDWTLMLMTPDWIDVTLFDAVSASVATKKGPPLIDELRLAPLAEGRCLQTLHIGPYDDEAPVLAHMHDEVIPSRGLTMTGKHHEIYLSDARRVAPAKLRTILRQPVREAPAT